MAGLGVCFSVMCIASNASAQEAVPLPPEEEQVIEPEVERREITVPEINVDDFELGATLGFLNVEEFGTNVALGIYLDYHISPEIFVEAAVTGSTVSDESFRQFGLPVFSDETETLLRYSISAAYSLLPGEMFFSKDWTMPSAIYAIGGIGATQYADEDQFTFNIGMGMRVLPTDGSVVKLEMRDYMFESDLLGSSELRHNLQLTAAFGFYF